MYIQPLKVTLEPFILLLLHSSGWWRYKGRFAHNTVINKLIPNK